MPIGDVVLLIGAINGSIGALALIAAPITVAAINRGKKKSDPEPEPVEQGQPAADPALAVERDRRRQAERELRAYRRALRHANDALARAGLPLVHPDL